MRQLADSERITRFMRVLGSSADEDGACYLTGGATAVLLGWRPSTIDVDIRLVPETERLLRAISELKDELRINVELASPAEFIPVPSGWEDRGVYVGREGRLTFYHFDPPRPGVGQARACSYAGSRGSISSKYVEPRAFGSSR